MSKCISGSKIRKVGQRPYENQKKRTGFEVGSGSIVTKP